MRAGVAPDAAAAKAAEEFAEVRKRQQELEKSAPKQELEEKAAEKAATEAKKERERRKKEKRQEMGEEGVQKREQKRIEALAKAKAAEKKRKRVAQAEVVDEAKNVSKKPKGDPQLSVFVGQMPFTADAQALKDHFVKAGIENVVSVRMLTEKSTNKSRGMAFVQLASQEDLLAALDLHQSEFCGRWINVERSSKTTIKQEIADSTETSVDKNQKVDQSLSVFVAQLPFTADQKSVRGYFEKSGVDVVSVKMLSEKGTNKKGMAFVQLASEDEVLAALELHQSQFSKNRWINVERSSKTEAKRRAAEGADENDEAE